MKKVIYILKSSDKTGLKLTAVYGLNWLVEQFVTWQFLIFGMVVLAGLSGLFIDKAHLFLANILSVLLLLPLGRMLYLRRLNDIGKTILLIMRNFWLCLIFIGIYDEPMTISELTNWIKLTLVSFLFYLVMKWLQPKLFEWYLLKNIINKEYMGIRKLTADLPPAENFYKDADEANADKGMAMINSRAVKLPYQKSVELSYLNSERQIGKSYSYDSEQERFRKNFTDIDTIYRPYFTLYPFGKEIDFYFKLISFELSRKDAFTKRGSAYLASK